MIGLQAGSLQVGGDLTAHTAIHFTIAQVVIAEPAAAGGRTLLRKPRLEWRALDEAFAGDEPDLFALLRWDHRLVETLHGREADLTAILDWATRGSTTPTVRLITGEGGSGKTRLAAAAAEILLGQGWSAGFLRPGDDLRDLAPSPHGLFLILDYPEEQPQRTRALLQALAELDTAPYPVRLVLLSRRDFAAWEREAACLGGRFGRQAVAAPRPLTGAEGEALIAEAAHRFAVRAGRPVPPLAAAAGWLAASPVHRLPLYATAAAVLAVLEPRRAFGLGRRDILCDLARRERGRIGRISEALGFGEDGLERLLAHAILGEGLNEAAATALLRAGLCPGATAPDPVAALARSPYWRGGRLAHLEPDAPAAAFLHAVLFASFPQGREAYPEWFFLALRERAASFGGRLSRLLYDLSLATEPAAGEPAPGPHPLMVCLLRMLSDAPERAQTFSAVARAKATAWSAEFAAAVALALARGLGDRIDAAAYFNNAGNYLSAMGRREEALSAAEQAVRILRELARERPDVFRPDLASSLNNLGNALSDIGRREEALSAIEEAVSIRRDLARERSDAFRPDLAMSLTNLSNRLSDVGRREEALSAAEQAVRILPDLARERPDVFRPDLARSLGSRSTVLEALERPSEAALGYLEGAGLVVPFHAAHPQAFEGLLGALMEGYRRAAALDALRRPRTPEA